MNRYKRTDSILGSIICSKVHSTTSKMVGEPIGQSWHIVVITSLVNRLSVICMTNMIGCIFINPDARPALPQDINHHNVLLPPAHYRVGCVNRQTGPSVNVDK